MIKDDFVRYVQYKLFNQLIELPIKAGEMLSLLVTLISLYVLPDQFEVHTQILYNRFNRLPSLRTSSVQTM